VEVTDFGKHSSLLQDGKNTAVKSLIVKAGTIKLFATVINSAP
jgi:hypothetical protein